MSGPQPETLQDRAQKAHLVSRWESNRADRLEGRDSTNHATAMDFHFFFVKYIIRGILRLTSYIVISSII